MQLGAFVIITGPSAAGKSTLVDEMLRRHPSAARLITTTTRAPRPGEVSGRDYHFTTPEDFTARRDRGEFLEWAEVHAHFYGSSREVLRRLRIDHPIVFGVVDVQGTATIKGVLPEARVVFVDAGNIREIRRRLSERPGTTPEDLERRVRNAAREERFVTERADLVSLVVVNRDGRLDEAIDRLDAFVNSLLTSGQIK